MTDPRMLTDAALINTIDTLAAASRETTAELIGHLAELERRNLHLACGFKSLFGYCRRVLHCSESASYDRMRAAHADGGSRSSSPCSPRAFSISPRCGSSDLA